MDIADPEQVCTVSPCLVKTVDILTMSPKSLQHMVKSTSQRAPAVSPGCGLGPHLLMRPYRALTMCPGQYCVCHLRRRRRSRRINCSCMRRHAASPAATIASPLWTPAAPASTSCASAGRGRSSAVRGGGGVLCEHTCGKYGRSSAVRHGARGCCVKTEHTCGWGVWEKLDSEPGMQGVHVLAWVCAKN